MIGRFCKTEAEKFGINYLDLQEDENRNTTIAFVTLTDGERDFAFNRHDTADYNLDFDKIDFDKYEDLKIIHLGSLMLSEKSGVKFAKKDQLITVTLGSKGSVYYYNGIIVTVPTEKVKPIDTTSAGDYFYLPFVAAGKFTVITDKTAEIIECLPSKQD